ncbi:response regulator [Algoriphagus vanfongensis]|uniref:response regulator n=1 Tax=Algoriphagus vanfongensis TaxID=426371 RepID=UPI00047BC4B4|nr:response regulator [Algoriphagus vanfongensis]
MDTKKEIYIYLADDDEDDRINFKNAIAELNLNTELKIVKNGKELMSNLNNIEVRLPDIIFLDLHMPVMGGLECLGQIRKSNRLHNIAVVIYSTSTLECDIEESLTRGANVYLRKPTDFDQLKTLIYKAIITNHHYTVSKQSRENFVMVI